MTVTGISGFVDSGLLGFFPFEFSLTVFLQLKSLHEMVLKRYRFICFVFLTFTYYASSTMKSLIVALQNLIRIIYNAYNPSTVLHNTFTK